MPEIETEEKIDPGSEEKNMDQTDFFDNSVFSMPEDEVFPNVVGENMAGMTGEQGASQKKPRSLGQRLLIVVAGVMLGVVVVLLAVLLLLQRVTRNEVDQPPPISQLEQSQLLGAVDDSLYIVDQLNNNFVLPQIKGVIEL